MRRDKSYQQLVMLFWGGCALALFSFLFSRLSFNGIVLTGLAIALTALVLLTIADRYYDSLDDDLDTLLDDEWHHPRCRGPEHCVCAYHHPKCISRKHAGCGFELEAFCDCRTLRMLDRAKRHGRP